MPKKKSIRSLVMCLADPAANPRPNRIIHLLAENDHAIDVLSYPASGEIPVENLYTIPVPIQSWAGRIATDVFAITSGQFARMGWVRLAEYMQDRRYSLHGIGAALEKTKYDLIVVEDLQLLPLAFHISLSNHHPKVLFDAREYYSKQNEESRKFRLFEWPVRIQCCNEYLLKCDHLLTVSPGLAETYYREFGVTMQVLRSTPCYRDFSMRSTQPDVIRLVHHGKANLNRSLANMIEIVRRLDERFVLDLYLVGPPKNIQSLMNRVRGCNRIRFRDPVSFEQVVPMLNQYDIGIFYVEPKTFNLLHCLPNKLFEFIQGRLAIAIGPSPDMADIVREYDCGFVADEFSIESMVRTLKDLTPDLIDRAKQNSHQAARELCFERESAKLLIELRRLLHEEVDPADRFECKKVTTC